MSRRMIAGATESEGFFPVAHAAARQIPQQPSGMVVYGKQFDAPQPPTSVKVLPARVSEQLVGMPQEHAAPCMPLEEKGLKESEHLTVCVDDRMQCEPFQVAAEDAMPDSRPSAKLTERISARCCSKQTDISKKTDLSAGTGEVLYHSTATLASLASIEGFEELHRGSNLAVILRNRGSVFSDSTGSAASYLLSKPVKVIDAFISHNWCVPGWQKWLCLSLHFNLRITIVLTFVVLSPLCVIAAYGWVPSCQFGFAKYPRSYIFRLLMFPVWFALLLFWRDILRCFTNWSPIVFLDKTCIHQEDKELQRQGIEKLCAHLCNSKTMVICYTDTYLKKLWTVYEVASFMTLQSVEQMRVLPVMFPIVFMTCTSCFWLSGVIGLLPELTVQFYYTTHFCLFAVCFAIIVAFRRWSRTKLAMHEKILKFSVKDCVCLCEEDRPLVYANIAALMKATQGIGNDVTEEITLACFDSLVRKKLYGALVSSAGRYAMRYRHAASAGCGFFAPVLDQLVGLAYGMPLRELFSYALWYATISFFIVPASFMGFSTWAELCMRFTGWREYVYLAFGFAVVFGMATLVREMLDLMEFWANESDLGLSLFALFCIVSSLMAWKAMDGAIFH